MKQLFVFILLSSCLHLQAQPDTFYLKSLYDRCLDFDESKRDSIPVYIKIIEDNSTKLKFKKGTVLTLRLRGLNEELHSDFTKALEYYLLSLEAAQQQGERVYEISALSDLAILYSKIEQPVMAKKYYLQCARLAMEANESFSLATSYNNLGIIYNQLGDHDSALIFLNEALKIYTGKEVNLDPSNTLNNIGNAWFKKGDYPKALTFFTRNYEKHSLGKGLLADLWVDHLNLADVYIELKKYRLAQVHADSALMIADSLGSIDKRSDSYSILAKLYARQKDYSKAYEFLTQWYKLDTAIINGSTQNRIAELQERYNLRERVAENKLLLTQIEKERYRSRSATYLAIALGLIGLLVAVALWIYRSANQKLTVKNQMILKQNERLEELNYEKNALIGIVSHDLSTPFATIQMWGSVINSDPSQNNEEQQKAIDRILKASQHGQSLIQRILDVERAELGNHRLHLETFDLVSLLKTVSTDFQPTAVKKEQQIVFSEMPEKVEIMCDRQLVYRIFENLISNALKYSPASKKVVISIVEERIWVDISIKDEGVGIPADELPLLFSKYSKISSRPTGGEPSTGLGLSIVKRIVEELNGELNCVSEEGKGSVFTVRLKK